MLQILRTKSLSNVLNLFKIKTSFLLFCTLLISFNLFSETKLIILGSGTPNPDPDRYGSGYAVVVNGSSYIVDFGPGIVRRISPEAPIPIYKSDSEVFVLGGAANVALKRKNYAKNKFQR